MKYVGSKDVRLWQDGCRYNGVKCRMYGCVIKESEYPSRTKYVEKTEPKVSITLWSIESNNHKQEVESQCQNQQGGYASIWMYHLKRVSPQCKINSGKYVSGINCHLTKPSSMSRLCPSVSISKSNINERSTTNHTTSNKNESPLLKAIVVIWREYLTSSKEIACPNVNKIKQGGMPQQKCTLTWSWPDVSWYL